MKTRRSFLKLTGGGIVIASAAGGWFMTRDSQAARAPWEIAGRTNGDPRRHALSYALLAPNPHNRQPWMADLGMADEVTLYCDLNRRLPHTDPFDRQITIGLGCFIELAVMAAAENGHRVAVTLFPDGEPHSRLDARPVASLRFTEAVNVERDPLFAHVLNRRSNKEAYDEAREVPSEVLAAIGQVALFGRVAHTTSRPRWRNCGRSPGKLWRPN
jgi:hypothetical protein